MSFVGGLLTGWILSGPNKDGAKSAWKPDVGTVYGHAYLGDRTDLPGQILVSGREWPKIGSSQRLLVKWIGVGAAPVDFDGTQWSWKRSEWTGGQLHLLD